MSTVTIGCKLPSGFIMQVTGSEKTHTIKGWNSSYVIGGHGITEDVPQELWNAWVKEYAHTNLYKGGFVFAHEQEKSVKAQAKEKAKNKSGQEQMEKPKDDEVK